MKVLIAVIVLVALPAAAYETFFSTYPDVPDPVWDRFLRALEIPSGGYACGRHSCGENDGMTILDEQGTIVDQSVGLPQAYDLLGDSCLIFADASCDDSLLQLTWTGLGGEVLSEANIDLYLAPFTWIYMVADMPDGGLAFCGQTYDYQHDRGFVGRVSPDLTLDWVHLINDEHGCELHALDVSTDGSVLAGGWYWEGTILICYSPEGDVLWTLYEPDGGYASQVAFTSSGCIAACSGSIMKLDSEGSVSWVFDPPTSWGSVGISGIAPAPGECTVAYACPGDSGPSRLFKLDPMGDLLWERELPDLGWGWVTACEAGGYLISGATCGDDDGVDSFLIRTDEDGCFGSEGVDPVDPCGSLSMTLTANPAMPMSAISVNLPEGVAASLSVYDMSGRRVAGTDWLPGASGFREFLIPELGSGIYFCRLSSGLESTSEAFVLLD
jgi:hypothetical protein